MGAKAKIFVQSHVVRFITAVIGYVKMSWFSLRKSRFPL